MSLYYSNSFPHDKISDGSKLKAFAGDKINRTLKQKFFFWVGKKTLWEKEKMLVTSIFSFFHNVFKRPLFIVGIVWKRVNPIPENKILLLLKLKPCADNKLNVNVKHKFCLSKGTKHCGKMIDNHFCFWLEVLCRINSISVI